MNEHKLIELLNSKMSHPLFSDGKTLLRVQKLPFFDDYRLVKAKVFHTIPMVEFSFLWNGHNNDVIKIDGSRECFFDNIELLRPQISVEYVKFVLGNVWNENGAMRLCQSVDEVEFSSTPSQAELDFLTNSIETATIENMVVHCNIVYGKALYRAKIELQESGVFEIVGEEQVGEEIEALRPIFLE